MDVRGKVLSLPEWEDIIEDRLSNPGQEPIYNVATPEEDDREYDAIFIGGGAAGRFGSAYLKARGGRQLMIDKWPFLGGSCPHEACVPHHVFSEAAKEIDYARNFAGQFWYPEWDDEKASILEVRDFFLENRDNAHAIMNFQSKEQLDLEFILDAYATVIDNHTVEVAGQRYTAKNLVLCTGARPSIPDIPGIELPGVFDFSTLLTDLDYEPKNCVIIGGSKIAIEYGSFFQATGCKTTLLSRSPLMRTASLHHVDEDIRQYVKLNMERRGITIEEGAETLEIYGDGKVEGVRYTNAAGEVVDVECDMLFLGTGEDSTLAPFKDALDLKMTEHGRVWVDSNMRTSIDNVWATGDLIEGPFEIFKARKSGVTAARNIMGQHWDFDVTEYPDFLHSTYEVAWTGLSEEEARERYQNVVVIQMPPKGVPHEECGMPASDGTMFYAMAHPELTGMLKSIIDADSRKVVGLHYVGYGIKNSFQYLDYLIKRTDGWTIDDFSEINELFLNELYPQLHRLRAGQRQLHDL